MKFQIFYQPNAAEELARAIEWSFEHYPETAKGWCSELLLAIEKLARDPFIWPEAPEDHYFDQTIRQLLYGKGRSIYRILYTVEEERIRILHIRFPGQPRINP